MSPSVSVAKSVPRVPCPPPEQLSRTHLLRATDTVKMNSVTLMIVQNTYLLIYSDTDCMGDQSCTCADRSDILQVIQQEIQKNKRNEPGAELR